MTFDAPKVSHVRAERVRWLWPGRIPLGKLTILDGDPGLGKSTVALDLAARLSTASPLPDGPRPEYPVNTVLLSAEDGIADTIRPRLDAAGANIDRITAVRSVSNEGEDSRPVVLPDDLPDLENLIVEDDARLVVVDPLMAFLAGSIDAHRDQDVRRALHALSALAERTGVALVILRHLNKMLGGNALYRGGGSIGIIGAARAALLVAPDPSNEQRRILACTKSNLAIKPKSLAYRLTSNIEHDCAQVVWDGESDLTADALLNPPRESKRDDAAEFLEDLLADGPVPVNEVKDRADIDGILPSTLKRAKQELGVESVREGKQGEVGGGLWLWKLPSKGTTDLQDQPPPNQMVPLITAGQKGSSNGQGVKGTIPDVERATGVA